MTIYDLAAIAQRTTDDEARAALEWADSYIMGLLAERAQLVETLRTAQHNASYFVAKLAEVDTERLRLEETLHQRTAQVEELQASKERLIARECAARAHMGQYRYPEMRTLAAAQPEGEIKAALDWLLAETHRMAVDYHTLAQINELEEEESDAALARSSLWSARWKWAATQKRMECKELLAWQEKVCAIIQPAENADEWGADVSDIIKSREAQRRAALVVVEAARQIHNRNMTGFRVSTGIIDALAAFDSALLADEGRENA